MTDERTGQIIPFRRPGQPVFIRALTTGDDPASVTDAELQRWRERRARDDRERIAGAHRPRRGAR